MTPQQYIQEELAKLKEFKPREVSKEKLADEIFHLVMLKKYRKYSANEELITKIKNAITFDIEHDQPINITFPHGAYKLWRLEESPLPDWAELFTTMYYTEWLKPICEIYQPGVWLDFFVDDLIIPKINNIAMEDVDAYIVSFQELLAFLKNYQPENFKTTITRFETLFPTHEAFEKALQEAVAQFATTNPTFSDAQLRVVEMNARPSPEQLKDPHWKEKVLMIHDPYIAMKRELGYYFQPGKIAIFNQGIPGKFLGVGTTKTSIAKFWAGVGALKKTEDGYKEYVLSPKQIEESHATKEATTIPGLTGKNFTAICIFS